MSKHLLFGFLLVFASVFTHLCQAQISDSVRAAPSSTASHRYLLLAKTGSLARYRMYIGEKITFKRHQDEGFKTLPILDIRDSTLYVQGLRVPLKDIEKIKLKNHTGGRKVANFSGAFLKTAGTIFTLVGAINFLTNLNEKYDRQDGLHTMGGAAVLFAAGTVLQAMRYGTYTINEKWTLKVIEMY
ncbi:hypothetical protein EFA69_01565 [Rufibacter immobilis]|uniref:Secreted protein n=1 Tax=Rufibacter immobilis TaxID=1348778 RepID=A0A3M9N5Q9_9BACT|nr:hypothetical protein [Rufibacter immobilis]RNI33134.1 hypothetical protein EFA69_01565 [Rufibacter immobilis]